MSRSRNLSLQLKIVSRNGLRFLVSPLLVGRGCLHAFGTRDLGASQARCHARIKEAFRGIQEIATVRQKHGTRYVEVKSPRDAARVRDVHADVILVRAPGLAAAVRTADCAPVLIYDPVTTAAAAVHSGWRGTAQGAPREAVTAMIELMGSRARDLVAAIGPCIGPCHYQVDRPVIEGIGEALGERAGEVMSPDGPDRARLDLSRANRLLLEAAGLSPENIEEARTCTYCRSDLFYSYRREGAGVPSLYHFIAAGV